jgi:hypothetical protein
MASCSVWAEDWALSGPLVDDSARVSDVGMVSIRHSAVNENESILEVMIHSPLLISEDSALAIGSDPKKPRPVGRSAY